MKKYIDAQLQVVRINNNIIATSGEKLGMGTNLESGTFEAGSADRFRDSWDAGY